MSTRARAVTAPRSLPYKLDHDAWVRHLREHLLPEGQWRPREFDPDRWLFTGDPDNPATTSTRCKVRACASLRTDLALARAEIKSLRAEREQHQHELRLALGARMDNLAKTDLVARVDELTQANTELAATVAQHLSDNQTLRARITDLEDELTAARTSLRRMIRAENRPATDPA